ncbi:alpha/beta hydrolase [Turneriella parva]|uniref:Hydrolase n=1 Tax=Turneriella parva (strain ATCC BAA-1111 / DSM 21527 / NCTC 11395 / H) TaxID=869212 RepID=I4B3H7_TURPD|nr:alpha/beta hydrolase [Turneriella parva]AFM11834.1 putative hydrolase [Turneriella parva DSM 21527]
MQTETEDLSTRLTKQLVGAATRFAFNESLPAPLLRKVIDQIGIISPPAPGCDLAMGSIDGIDYDFWTPKNATPGRILLYSHGGGYVMFSHKSHRSLASRLAVEFSAQAIVYNYRLAPEHPFPAAIDDALTVYEHVLKLGYDPKNIILAGDSAGGGITFALMLAARDKGLPLPGLAIGLSPWVDMTLSGVSMRDNPPTDVMLQPEDIRGFIAKYLAGGDPKHAYASPLFGDLRGLPPVMLQAAGDEVLRDDSVMLAAALRAAGVAVELDVWPGLFHVFEFAWRFLPQSNEAIVKMGDFVRRHFSRS